MVVLRSISFVITLPRVSIPSERGVTSRSNTSFTSPVRTPPWIAAPMATTSSGFTPLCGSFPKNSLTISCTLGIRVIPPTRITSLISFAVHPASFSALRQGSRQRLTRSSTSDSNFARVILRFRCFGPDASAVMKGKLTSVSELLDNSCLAFSAVSLSR